MCGPDILLHDEYLHPLVNNILIILPNKCHGDFLVFNGHGLNSFFVAYTNLYKFAILYYEVENAFAVGITNMHMYRLVFS